MNKKIMLVGDVLTADDNGTSQPFAGAVGWLLSGMLSHIGLTFRDVHTTVVFNKRTSVRSLLGTKAEGIEGMPIIEDKKYVRKEYATELERLREEIRAVQPNVVVAMGHVAAWALLGTTGIRAIRGAATSTDYGVKVIPTYHPAQVQRDYSLRPIVTADLNKAKRQSEFPELRRPERHIWIRPTLEDIARYEQEYIIPAERLSIDIETKGDQITCIGFAPSVSSAIVIPIFSNNGGTVNYWKTLEEELAVWDYIRRWCQKPALFQNGLYDMQFLWRRYGIPCRGQQHDTMLLHHAMQLEMEKGLGFLGTLYTDEASWKHLSKTDTIKKAD